MEATNMIPEIRKNCKYAAACVTSMGVRITPENRMAVHNSDLFYLQATSAESNVLNVISSLGKPCLVMTKFVEGSPIAAFIKAKLRARNISFEGPDVPQGGPWGYRHQFNIAAACGLRVYGMTEREKSEERLHRRILISREFSEKKVSAFCICPA